MIYERTFEYNTFRAILPTATASGAHRLSTLGAVRRRRKWKRLVRSGGLALARRRTAMLADRIAATAWKRMGKRLRSVLWDGEPRFALVTVNFSTTRYLKLLLLTLSEQEHLGLLHRIVVVDNGSRDGGAELLDRLADRILRLHVVHRRHWLGHGPGMRAGVRALDRIERYEARSANLLLFCDTDVVFRSPETLIVLAGTALQHDAALMGEVRSGVNAQPDIQASFFVVRRDVHARRDVAPAVHDGAPAYRMQRSIAAAGLPVVHVPTNHGGLTLHRGRAGVDAASRYRPRHHYAGVKTNLPHFMGVPGGAEIWSEIDQRWAHLLTPEAEDELVDVLATRFEALGTAVLTD